MFTRDTAIFYPGATCNLHCRYCNIDKNEHLLDIDKALEESYQGDYYINLVKKYFPRRDTLQKIETWGAEPFLHMDRIYPLIDQLIKEYPFFKQFFSSTNFAFSNWTDRLFGLFDCFGKYPYRDFDICIQLSVDGPTEYNDAGRGQGVTERCLKNYNKTLDLIREGRLPKNIHLTFTTKGTLDIGILPKLNNKETLIEYFKFIEDNYIEPCRNLCDPQVGITVSIPNTAVPAPVTKRVGQQFAELTRLCREIEIENASNRIFKFYERITPYASDVIQENITYAYGFNNCGAGYSSIGFLPHGMLSTCHEGFAQLAKEYLHAAAISNRESREDASITLDKFADEQQVVTCVDEEGYKTFERRMSYFNTEGQTSRLVASTVLIMALAMAGEIEPIYLDETEALKASIFIQSHTSFCFKDNYNMTGSYLLQPSGQFKLFLNGAKQYIELGDSCYNV